jgi:hypothetical protein
VHADINGLQMFYEIRGTPGPVKVPGSAAARRDLRDQAKRAKKKIRALAGNAGMDGPWYWALPEHEGDLDDLTEESTNSAKGAGHVSLHPSLPSALPSPDPSGPHARYARQDTSAGVHDVHGGEHGGDEATP